MYVAVTFYAVRTYSIGPTSSCVEDIVLSSAAPSLERKRGRRTQRKRHVQRDGCRRAVRWCQGKVISGEGDVKERICGKGSECTCESVWLEVGDERYTCSPLFIKVYGKHVVELWYIYNQLHTHSTVT